MSNDQAAKPLRMGQNEFVGFLATISATTALGIDMVLPAFGEVREAFGLDESSTQVALTVTVYFLGLSLAQIFYGPLTDRFGRKPVLLIGLGLYALGALSAGLAPSLPLLLLSRLLWGVAAAGPRVLMMAIARDVHDGDRLGRVLSLAQAIFMIVPAFARCSDKRCWASAAGAWFSCSPCFSRSACCCGRSGWMRPWHLRIDGRSISQRRQGPSEP